MAFKFEGLTIWQKALELTEIVNRVSKEFPQEELYVLTSQIRRASDSVALNIAEGSQGQSNAEFNRFLGMALRSGIEVVACIFIAQKRNIITEENFTLIYTRQEELAKMISGLRNKLKE